MWIEWTIAVRFLLEGRRQSLMILAGIAIGVAVIVFLSALIGGLQENLIQRTLGTQAHIKLEAPDEVNTVLPVPAGTGRGSGPRGRRAGTADRPFTGCRESR